MPTLLAALALVPAVFGQRAGWYVGHGTIHACSGVSTARCVQAGSWASTIPWRGCGACLPHRMIGALPPGGIALHVEVSVEHPLAARRGGVWPPVIDARDLSGIEGVSNRYAVFQLFARFGQIDAYVWAFFGRAHPTAAQLAAANAELRTVKLGR
jgi:hypothetical protein